MNGFLYNYLYLLHVNKLHELKNSSRRIIKPSKTGI